MSNALQIGLFSPGNALELYETPPSVGLSYGVATVQAVALYGGVSFGVGSATAVGSALALANGMSLGIADTVIAQGLSNRGNGFSYGVATVFANNALALGFADGAATVDGVGLSHSEFAPYLMWNGYTSDGTAITIPLADLDAILDASEADAATGDWRKVMQSFLMKAVSHYAAMIAVEGGTPQTYRTLMRTNYNASYQGIYPALRRTFISRFNLDYATGNVADEP